MGKNALVIGATGLLGYNVAVELSKSGWKVRAIGKEAVSNFGLFGSNIEYMSGDFYDQTFLESNLEGIDKVFFFLSTTFPSSNVNDLELEVSKTFFGLDYLLRNMIKKNVKEIVFPSSGGTIYGNIEKECVCETDITNPSTPYGVGKKISEEILKFYSTKGISSTVVRVGNVYGGRFSRNTNQGVIDIFIQKALNHEQVSVWGNSLHNTRDYIFVDDLADAIVKLAEYKPEGFEIYNLSSGVGTTLEEIINIINDNLESPLDVKYVDNKATDSIRKIVLDISKIEKKILWKPKYSIKNGIIETIKRKKNLRGE
ncbi:MAG: NAD-dependent epimerase/dehydratase family protein [Acholeplasmatales bacterium]|nr:NAD-dependent epimerase/dehydratase family protein [Acholeplasmatales bacterium]